MSQILSPRQHASEDIYASFLTTAALDDRSNQKLNSNMQKLQPLLSDVTL